MSQSVSSFLLADKNPWIRLQSEQFSMIKNSYLVCPENTFSDSVARETTQC